MISLIPTAHAASKAQISAQCFVDKINDAILFPLIALMMALAFLFFLYGAFEYVRNAANDSGRETGRRHLMYGVIGMLVMLSAFAILNIAAGTFGLTIDEYRCADNKSASKGTDKFSGSSLNTQTGTNRGPSNGYIPSWSGESGESFGGDGTSSCFSVSGSCGPSTLADPYRALREEVQYSGGLATGVTTLGLIEEGNASLALDKINELYQRNQITAPTRDRLIDAVSADAVNRPGYTGGINLGEIGSNLQPEPWNEDPESGSVDTVENTSGPANVSSEDTTPRSTSGVARIAQDLIGSGWDGLTAFSLSEKYIDLTDRDVAYKSLTKLVEAGTILASTRDQYLLEQFGSE